MTITPIEDLEKEVDDIEAYLSTLPPEDANLAIERGNELSVYFGCKVLSGQGTIRKHRLQPRETSWLPCIGSKATCRSILSA